MTVQFELEWKTNIVTRLERVDTTGVQRRYWFDSDVLADQWWEDRLLEAVSAARPRYVPELNIEVSALQSIAALCSDDEWWLVVSKQIGAVAEASTRVRRADDAALAADLDKVVEAAGKVKDALSTWHQSRTAADLDALAEALDQAREVVMAQEAAEVDAMDTQHGAGAWDHAGWRQYQAEYMVSFPAAAVDALRELLEQLTNAAEELVGLHGRLSAAQVALMTGGAGIGKTYVAIDAVARRLGQGRPSVMLHGRWFTDDDPLTQLRDRLQMPSDLTGEEALALLDERARVAGVPTLLVIDALNETRPRSTWRDHLERLITTVERYPNLRLLLTARTHYVAQLLPHGLVLPRFEHMGFEGVEFEAVTDYAAFYGLEPPTSPPIHGEFDNPLYLRLVCEALQQHGRLSLERPAMGLDELTHMVLNNANNIISDRIDASPSDRIVQRGMHALAAAIADSGQPWLTRPDAQALLTPIWPELTAEKSLLDALVAQGPIEEDVVPDGSPHGADIITITFERIGHHLIVADALNGATDAASITTELNGRLGQLIGLGGTLDLGLLEATSVVIAERFGLELTQFRTNIGNDNALLAAVIAGTAWRNENSINDETRNVILEALTNPETSYDAMTMLFRLAARPDHPLNADHLHDLLLDLDMAHRDAFMADWFHTTHGTSGALDRLIRWAREKPLDQVGEETTRLWVTALLWATSATDRRVRDQATIAAARLLTHKPNQAATVLHRFLTGDDEWVVERACEAAYTALLANGTQEHWAAAADILWTTVFAGQVTPNAAVRDAARALLEAAADRNALPAGVTPDQFRPPYASNWPIIWPTDDDVAPYKDRDNYPKLVYSTTGDDFFVYRLTHALRKRAGIDPNDAARWVVTEIIRLGYRPELHAAFDGYVLNVFGGGRSKPKYVERIGKKYQWIALNRLAGIVTDNVPKTLDRWDPPPPVIPGPLTDESRQLDPTIVEYPTFNPTPRTWVPTYDWTPTTTKTDADWIADETDIPNIDITNAALDERPHTVIDGTYEWTNATDDIKRSRIIWTHLNAILVRTEDLASAINELDGRDLNGHDVTRGPELYHGYIAEFPYGHHHGEDIHLIHHEWSEPLSVPTRPASWGLRGEYEYAPGDQSGISLDAPALAQQLIRSGKDWRLGACANGHTTVRAENVRLVLVAEERGRAGVQVWSQAARRPR